MFLKSLSLGAILFTGTLLAQNGSCNTDSISSVLEDAYQRDQAVREELMPLLARYQQEGSGQMELVMKAREMEEVDRQNQALLSNYLARCGWSEKLSPKAHQAVFLILQHAPDSLMRAHFAAVEQRVAEGHLSAADWATMYDRLRMRAEKAQRFGTQTFASKENVNWVWPIAPSQDIQARRDSVGLPSMADYLSLARDSTGVEIRWNRNLTIEEALSIKQGR